MPKQYRLDKFEMPDILALEPKLRKKVMRAAAKIARDAAKGLVPVRTGALKKSLTYTVDRYGYRGKVKSKKGSEGGPKPARYAHLVHDGTAPHDIHATSKESARSGWRIYHGSLHTTVKHPGSHGTPYLTEAGERSRPEIEQAMADKAQEVLAEVAAGR